LKTTSPILHGVAFLFACATTALAQDATPPALPKILQITREFVKPGKDGPLHDKLESGFVQAMSRAKAPGHWLGFSSMTGRPSSIFLTGYSSFDDWHSVNKAASANAALTAEMDRVAAADGELLDSKDEAVYASVEEMSYNDKADFSRARYLDISTYRIKPGHGGEWSDIVKLIKDGYAKTGTIFHWGMFHLLYGGEDDTYIVVSSKESMKEVDIRFEDENRLGQILGEEGGKKLGELIRSSIQSISHQLYAVNPQQSYVDEAWIKADPAFWKPKTNVAPSAAKPAAKAPAAPKP